MTPDEQEASSLKYSRSLSILALSSGKFALFFPWSNDGGLPLAKIADWSELEADVRAWRSAPEPKPIIQQRTLDAINLDELFANHTEAKRGDFGRY
jgi:hypothetical protein